MSSLCVKFQPSRTPPSDRFWWGILVLLVLLLLLLLVTGVKQSQHLVFRTWTKTGVWQFSLGQMLLGKSQLDSCHQVLICGSNFVVKSQTWSRHLSARFWRGVVLLVGTGVKQSQLLAFKTWTKSGVWQYLLHFCPRVPLIPHHSISNQVKTILFATINLWIDVLMIIILLQLCLRYGLIVIPDIALGSAPFDKK